MIGIIHYNRDLAFFGSLQWYPDVVLQVGLLQIMQEITRDADFVIELDEAAFIKVGEGGSHIVFADVEILHQHAFHFAASFPRGSHGLIQFLLVEYSLGR
jgi:hypothetical protein